MNRVYVVACRLTPDAERIASREIDRERALYNQMIAEYNPHPRQRALAVSARHKLAEGDCYTGSHFAAMNDFQRAASAKRVGVWPGDPYRFRSCRSNDGAMVGVVFMKSSGMTWGKVAGGSSRILRIEPPEGKYSRVSLKVAREEEPISFSCHVRRDIPPDAIVTAVYLARTGSFARRHKWELRVTFSTEADATAKPELSVTCGVNLGWKIDDDGSMVVARTSDGRELRLPAYAIRMAPRHGEIQAERDEGANRQRERLGGTCPAKSANGTAAWCEQHRPESEREYIEWDRALRCRQDHVRERFDNIRRDHYRKFVASLVGQVYILKPNLKESAEEILKDTFDNRVRGWAGLSELHQLLRNAGSVEVKCERLSNEREPTIENAEKIRGAGCSGSLLERAARKPVRKFRKRLEAA